MFPDKNYLFFADKNHKPIFVGSKLTDGIHIYKVISENDLGLCIQNTKTKTIEALTSEIAGQLRILPKKTIGDYICKAAIRVNEFRRKWIVRREL